MVSSSVHQDRTRVGPSSACYPSGRPQARLRVRLRQVLRARQREDHLRSVRGKSDDIGRTPSPLRPHQSSENIPLFVKLPGWFEIDTPVGKHNPDRATINHDDSTIYL